METDDPTYVKVGTTYTDWDGGRHSYELFVCNGCGNAVIDQGLHTRGHRTGNLPVGG